METDDFIDYARQYICDKKAILFLDPIWDRYTSEDILTEYFSIRLKEDDLFKMNMEASFVTLSKEDEDFFNRMTAEYEAKKVDKEAPEVLPDTIEDSFE